MNTEYLKLQKSFARDKRGRFIPYIGKEFDKGLNKNRIVIVGPRHYCDGINNSRNVLIGLSDILSDKKKKKSLESGKQHDFEVGCIEENAEKCLRQEGKSPCPVYKDKTCLLKSDCQIKGVLGCDGKRNLRCETLYAINEFINEPKIESMRLGILYFTQITDFIRSHLKIVQGSSSQIWERVAFFNLIQRYIPLMGIHFDSNLIRNKIQNEDIKTGMDLIKKLNPDIVITTMPCISSVLNKELNEIGYKGRICDRILGYNLYCRESLQLYEEKYEWQVQMDRLIDEYTLPIYSRELRKFARELSYQIYFQYGSKIKGKSPENEIRKYLHSIISDKINKENNVSCSISKLSCFKTSGDKAIEAMRQWMRYKGKDEM